MAVVDPDGSVRSKQAIQTPQGEPDALGRTLRGFLQEHEAGVSGAVVGVPGPVDYSAGEVLKLPNLPEWEGQISSDQLSTTLGLPVLIANDADLAALAEHRYGAGRGSQDMVYITVSTGVGAGVILNGRLLHGRVSRAEIGHTIIDKSTRGTVESLGSGTALARLSGEDAPTVEARAKSGDQDALGHFAAAAGYLAIGVVQPSALLFAGDRGGWGRDVSGRDLCSWTPSASCSPSATKPVRPRQPGWSAPWAETTSGSEAPRHTGPTITRADGASTGAGVDAPSTTP